MAKDDRPAKKAKRAGPVSPLLAGVGIGLAWAALHAPVGPPQALDLLVWLIRAAAAGVLASAALLIGLAVIEYAATSVRLLWQKAGVR